MDCTRNSQQMSEVFLFKLGGCVSALESPLPRPFLILSGGWGRGGCRCQFHNTVALPCLVLRTAGGHSLPTVVGVSLVGAQPSS